MTCIQCLGSQEETSNYLLSKGEFSSGLFKSTESVAPRIIRPMSRKDLFYSGSIKNLPEYQSQKSINCYRQSILNLPRETGLDGEGTEIQKPKPILCPCIGDRAGAFTVALAELMDFSLLKNPVFLCIAISGVVGMLGFYTPFVYIIDYCVSKVSMKEESLY